MVNNMPADARDVGPIPELGRSPGGAHGNPLQYSCLENPMNRGAWRVRWGREELDRTAIKHTGKDTE